MIYVMSEAPTDTVYDDSMAEHLPSAGGPDYEPSAAPVLSPEELRVAYGGWLERRGINPADIPHITMDSRAYDVFRNAPPAYADYVKQCYGILQGDQDNCQYALVEVAPDDPDSEPIPQLVVTNQVDFGTPIDYEVIADDFAQPGSDPNNPSAPESSGGAFRTADISDELASSWTELDVFAKTLMSGESTDPFSTSEGDIGIRAGGIRPGQEDAFVWDGLNPFKNSLALTASLPGLYDSVCVVRGKRRAEPINGKRGMAQIEHPVEVLKIEGENLKALQDVYRKLYAQPDFAVSEAQRHERDRLMDSYLVSLISTEAQKDSTQQDDDYEHPLQAPKAREIPLR